VGIKNLKQGAMVRAKSLGEHWSFSKNQRSLSRNFFKDVKAETQRMVFLWRIIDWGRPQENSEQSTAFEVRWGSS